MDFFKYAFALQLRDETDITVLRSIELNLRCGKDADGIDRMLARFKKDFASRASSYAKPWFSSLIAAIRPFYQKPSREDGDTSPDSDYYNNAFNEFMAATLKKLNGGRSLFMLLGKPPQFDLSHFSSDELAQPHMQWLPLFVARHQALREAFPEQKNVMAMACIHPDHQISDEMLLALKETYHQDEFDIVMSFVQYVDWYLKSRQHFAVESVQINPDYEARMANTLHAWHTNRPDETIETHVDWLCRNYEFHPQHRAFITQWATEQVAKYSLS